MLTYYKGMKALEKAAFSATYQSVWCAGTSVEFTHQIEPLGQIVRRFQNEFNEAQDQLKKILERT
jgi:nitronate monooxygenase